MVVHFMFLTNKSINTDVEFIEGLIRDDMKTDSLRQSLIHKKIPLK